MPELANELYPNVIWSNGERDPWAVGGVFTSSHSIVITNGAHHSDLSDPTPFDTDEVVAARELERKIIATFLKETKNAPKHFKLSYLEIRQ